MKQEHTLREKGQAVFLAALMVLSVFAMSAAFAGAAAADVSNLSENDGPGDVAVGQDGVEQTFAINVDMADDGAEDTDTITVDVSALNSIDNAEVATVESVEAGSDAGVDIDASGANYDSEADEVTFDVTNNNHDGTTAETTNDVVTVTLTVDAQDADAADGDDIQYSAESDTNTESVTLTGFALIEATGSITGTVTDAADNSAIEGATVTAEADGEEFTAETDADGLYTVEGLADGDYDVTAAASGYQTTTVAESVTVADGADNPDNDVSLEEVDVEYEPEQSIYYEGQEITATGLEPNSDYQLRSVDSYNDDGDVASSSFETELTTDENGELTIDTEGFENNDYFVRGENVDENRANAFELTTQSFDAEFSENTVTNDGDNTDAELELSSNRGTYDVEVTADDLDSDDLNEIFGDSVEETTDDGVILANSDTSADFDGIDAGEYNFTVEVTDTSAEDSASIEVEEPDAATAQFDSSTYSQTAGDIVELTVDMEGTDHATIELIEDEENYNVTLAVTDHEGDGEVTVYFNTYNAGQGEDADGDVFWANDDNEVTADDETDFDGDFRLLPSDFNLELLVNGEETDVATLILTERSTGDVEPGVAPADAEIEDADDIDDVTTSGSDVAEDDYQIIGFDINGIFGQLGDEETNAHAINESADFDVEIEHTNPGSYQNPHELNLNDVRVIMDSENDRMFFVIDTEADAAVEAGQNYDVTLTINEGYYDSDDDEETATSFSVIDREIEVTGEWDDDERLQVENSEEANVTGESTAAPGTDVRVRLRATGDDPFLMTETVEVDSDGVVDASFDLSEHEEGQNFTVRMTDQHDDDVQDEVNAVLVASADEPAPHTVTITVYNADGEPVEGADVTVGDQTETTNANGEATFELAHGEYDVTATYDGEEASGTLTVDDDTADTGTLTLGSEDVGDIGDADDDDADDGVDDYDDGVDDHDDAADDYDDAADDHDDHDDDTEDQPGFGIAVALIALLAAAGIALRKRA